MASKEQEQYSFVDDGYVYVCPDCEMIIDNKDIHPFQNHYVCPHCKKLQDTLITYERAEIKYLKEEL